MGQQLNYIVTHLAGPDNMPGSHGPSVVQSIFSLTSSLLGQLIKCFATL